MCRIVQYRWMCFVSLLLVQFICVQAVYGDAKFIVDHGDGRVGDSNESFMDRGFRHYQQYVDVDANSRDFDTYINVVYGNLIHKREDIFIPGLGLPLRIVFTYNSGSCFNGRFGFGWQMNYNIRYVTNDQNENIIIVRPCDRTDIFEKQDDGSFRSTYGINDSLLATESGFKLIVWRDTWNNRGDYAVYHFDSPDHHYVTKIEDRYGKTLTFDYDGEKQLTSVTDASGRSIMFTYSDKKLSQIFDPSGRVFSYTYLGENMVHCKDPMDHVLTYAYSESCHDLLSVADKGENVFSFVYNDQYAVSSVLDPLGTLAFTFSYAWTGSGTTTVTNANGHVTSYVYDARDCVTSTTNAAGGNRTKSWDENFLLAHESDENGNRSSFTYDLRGNRVQSTDALGNTNSYVYDNTFNKLIRHTNENGQNTTYERDEKGNVLSRTDDMGNATNYTLRIIRKNSRSMPTETEFGRRDRMSRKTWNMILLVISLLL